MGKESLGQQGYDYTDYGQKALEDQAAQNAADAQWFRDAQKEQWQIQKDQNALAVRQAQRAYDDDPMNFVKRKAGQFNDWVGSLF